MTFESQLTRAIAKNKINLFMNVSRGVQLGIESNQNLNGLKTCLIHPFRPIKKSNGVVKKFDLGQLRHDIYVLASYIVDLPG